MKSMVMSFFMKFLDTDVLCSLIAKAIAAILSHASKRGGKAWDVAKTAIVKVNLWTSLFLQVYEDETLSAEDEKLIAEAIKKETDVEKLVDIIKKNADKADEN